jgi:hypothetical protein
VSYYVERERSGAVGWVGPIRSGRQADREATAWQDVGWHAVAVPTSPEVRTAVLEWVKSVKRAG